MSYYKFEQNDIFVNNVKTFPRVQFYIYGGKVYYQNKLTVFGDHTVGGQTIEKVDQGEFTSSATNVPEGHISLHEINVDMPERSDRRSFIYPFITKQGSLTAFKTISTSQFNSDFQYGDVLKGSYPLSASIQREYFAANHAAKVTSAGGIVVDYFNKNDDAGDSNRIVALKNTLNYYTALSSHYAYSSSLDDSQGGWDKDKQEQGLISIPSIFYGSSIKKGSVELNFYVTGSLIGQLKDEKNNGELIQTLPTGHERSGSVAGVVLYNEGFVLLTGSWDISDGEHTEPYLGSDNLVPKWVHYAAGANDSYMQGGTHTASSFQMSFYGTAYTPTITMFARAPKGYLNHSNNPTYINFDHYGKFTSPATGTGYYVEREDVKIKNTVSGAYTDHTSSFAKQTYISKIGLYDKEKNLIAIAKMATPVKKTEDRDLTFKLKLDI